MSDNVVSLIKDLTTRLGAMADEFGSRAASMRPDLLSPSRSPQRLTAQAQDILDQRRRRRAFLPADLFGEPAWDMLLALFVARDDPRPFNVKALAVCVDCPLTTTQRWIDHLHRIGLITRTTDPVDRRRVEVALTQTALDALVGYLDGQPPFLSRLAASPLTSGH